MALTPTSELEAVNIMLTTIGESPVSSLEVSGLSDVAIAKNILAEVSRAVQSKGWHFNTEEEYELSPTTDGFLMPPANTMRVDTNKAYADIDVAHRGDKLYDRKNHTFVFTDPVQVDLIILLAFTDMPEAARYYVTIKAARIFQRRVMGADTLEHFTGVEEEAAHLILLEAEGDTGDYNMLNGSYSVATILDRN